MQILEILDYRGDNEAYARSQRLIKAFSENITRVENNAAVKDLVLRFKPGLSAKDWKDSVLSIVGAKRKHYCLNVSTIRDQRNHVEQDNTIDSTLIFSISPNVVFWYAEKQTGNPILLGHVPIADVARIIEAKDQTLGRNIAKTVPSHFFTQDVSNLDNAIFMGLSIKRKHLYTHGNRIQSDYEIPVPVNITPYFLDSSDNLILLNPVTKILDVEDYYGLKCLEMDGSRVAKAATIKESQHAKELLQEYEKLGELFNGIDNEVQSSDWLRLTKIKDAYTASKGRSNKAATKDLEGIANNYGYDYGYHVEVTYETLYIKVKEIAIANGIEPHGLKDHPAIEEDTECLNITKWINRVFTQEDITRLRLERVMLLLEDHAQSNPEGRIILKEVQKLKEIEDNPNLATDLINTIVNNSAAIEKSLLVAALEVLAGTDTTGKFI